MALTRKNSFDSSGDKSGVGRTGGWMGGVTPSSEKPPTRPGDLEIQEAEDISQVKKTMNRKRLVE